MALSAPIISLSGDNLTINFDAMSSTTKFNSAKIRVERDDGAAAEFYIKNIKNYSITTSGIGSYGWTKTTTYNPNTSFFDGTYQSENYNKSSSQAVMKITFKGFTSFPLWINSYAESNYDYTICSNLDAASYPTSSTSTTMSTYGFQKDPSIFSTSNWRNVIYTSDTNEHSFYVVFRKDGSVNSNNDRGYCLIPFIDNVTIDLSTLFPDSPYGTFKAKISVTSPSAEQSAYSNEVTNDPSSVTSKLYLGTNNIKQLYLGQDKVKRIYLGTTLIYENLD